MATKTAKTITVYVNAWQYNTGAGFDWYRRPGDADKAFEEEKGNCEELAEEGWSAYRFDVAVPSVLSDEEITALIDEDLDGLCVKAERKVENVLAEYGEVLSKINPAKLQTTFKAVQFCYTNKSGGTNMVHCRVEGVKLSEYQRCSAQMGGDQRVKWLAEFTVTRQWSDHETGQRMIGVPINKELKTFLRRHAKADKQVIYVGQHDLVQGS